MSDRNDRKFLDDEERGMAEDIDEMDISDLRKPSASRQSELRRTARNTLRRRESKMNIRIDTDELERIKQRADQEGLRYQTLVKSVLHKYLTGQLVDRGDRSG